jgi:5-formyltetrahydrofolate cyclo-ligase
MLSRWEPWAEDVPLEDLAEIDLIVTGCVAVTRQGRRAGKGEGYSDLEFAILRELGHPAPPVVTTVHPLQVVDAFPVEPHDLGLSVIATPEAVYEPDDPPDGPRGIDWSLLDEEDREEMPILRELRG